MIYFETHSTSTDNEAGLASGHRDADLSPIGEVQALDLGRRYSAVELDAVLCSDLRRSFRTAEIAFGGRSLPILRDSRLRECDYGDLTGAPATLIRVEQARRIDTPFPNGQSLREVVQGVRACLADHASLSSVLVIGHRVTFYALEHLLNRVALETVVSAPWQWQPGWKYVRTLKRF